MNPLKNTLPLLGQLVKHIPGKLPDTLARKHKIQSRSFSPTSHVVAMMYAQFSHALSLNDVCDALQNHQSYLSQIRDCTPPSRNGPSHANLTRNADMNKLRIVIPYDFSPHDLIFVVVSEESIRKQLPPF